MKIYYQSYINRELSNSYFESLTDYLNQVKNHDTELTVGEMFPPDRYAHAAVEYAAGYQAIKNTLQAEKDGYDAVILGHFQDSGLQEAKAVVDIPVLGLGETNMLFACSQARKLGLITINPRFIPGHEEQVARYGLQDRIIGIRAIQFEPSQLTACLGNPALTQEMLTSFQEQAQPLVDAGADLIIPAGGIPMLLIAQFSGFSVDNAPIFNGLSVIIKHAEMAVELANLNGYHISRKGMFSKLPRDVADEFYC
ncbi:MAG: aspartate/glutamate racemase family protein [Pseudomonadota bacterium]